VRQVDNLRLGRNRQDHAAQDAGEHVLLAEVRQQGNAGHESE
jgi:hypothetical protein